MKQRQYTITTGSYDDYEVVGRIAGPTTPALSTLWKQFAAEFGVFAQPEPKWNEGGWSQWQMAKIEANANARTQMSDAGYAGNMAEAFIAWLVGQHGFERLNSDLFHVSG